ncbi:MAG: thiamine phosphate synthase [Pseudomonadota bacterium]
MSDLEVSARCRLVLVVPKELEATDELVSAIKSAASGGDVASIIVPQHGLSDEQYQDLLEAVAAVTQNHGIALIGCGEKRILSRAGVDGEHLIGGASEVFAHLEQKKDDLIAGVFGGQTRHAALEMGEARPDYLFFGKFGGDTKIETHPRFLELAGWWAEMVEIPAILLAGASLESVAEAASSGVDFVALSRAVFMNDALTPEEAVRHANATLANYPLAYAE